MLRMFFIAAALLLGSLVPQEAAACEASCSGGSCTGTGSCGCSGGEPVCKDGSCLVSQPTCFASAAENSEKFIRNVEAQLGDQLAVSELRKAIEEGKRALSRGDKAALDAARARATTALQSLTPEEQKLVGQINDSL
ncbi:hypothetical protein D7Y13_07955 [Corallococcus praedator]|uniref:Uncharacterized protein n=1 Tax=Corallococcus praedator TaxID=2316724 RepID=A0ABX9QM71_9BACT|nr:MULTISPECIES: hypothetical protein [Corallococcus]RKH32070.1 hypothetical protein D7X75_17245 [Corallococcus sp. CA031C]RKI13248.1 hypothetical protein D7Y13_07955 [Corallococcus praedator]